MKNLLVLPMLTLGVAVISSACGPSTGTTSSAAGSATGTVGGVSLGVQDAFFANGVTTGTVVGVTSFSGACETLYSSKRYPRSSVGLSLQLIAYEGGGPAGPVTAPGTFALLGTSVGGDTFGASWDSVDGSCGDTTTQATGGTVTVTAVTASQLTGTFDLTFGGDHVTGSFSATDCAAAAGSQGNPTCS